LLQQSGSLDGLYQQLEQVPEKWRGKLERHRELAYVSKHVATLRTDLSLDGNLQQLRLPIQ
ncbi:flap endonuclease Xni, partial [Serratia marcescens]|nr:flap endonuclease Xni [Serratia marcescens]